MFPFERPTVVVANGKRGMGSGLLSIGLFFLFFGLLIFAAPNLLEYIVATFFIVTGISLLMTWWTMRR